MSRTAKLAHEVEVAQPDFNGAALIDDQGNEIAITEEMVRGAIQSLDRDAYPNHSGDESVSADGKTQFADN